MVLMGVGDEDGEEVLALALDEAGVREHQVDARQPLLARKPEADIDEDPLARPRRPEPVEGGIHADLAEPAEGHEHELVGEVMG